ncbi:Predicted acetyltransferase [Halobacillus alkaliphilus]|uniref:Predicted acetyltransferase n=1 Tax=Halobacillus alkaliphilus TaxID=396056 RepID=A0A1I2STS0_9BACI|nr:GNAT family N-acetyltransferase [Halobacillus alkaliphilus]SFG56120.1 Predicted acetyltransferase [Halobacillus alkaliphilus]
MNEELYLVKPTVELEKEYLSFYNEWLESGEKMVPWVIKKNPVPFGEMVQYLINQENGVKLPEGRVPTSTYWLINTEKKILGVVNIRHDLTELLRNSGGHIGYGIRPSERRKGYASKLLELSLEKANGLGINEALVVCDEWNTASFNTILNNGGNPDEDYIEEDGNVLKRFWLKK